MPKKADYSTRCYSSYNSTHWEETHCSDNNKEYRFLSKIYSHRFGKLLPSPRKKPEIIDIACGAGHFLYFLQQNGYPQAAGIDRSAEMIQRSRNAGIRNLHRDNLFEFLPNHEGAFDLIIAMDIIEHFKKPQLMECLDLIHAALKPGGMCLFTTINTQSLFGAGTVYHDFTHEWGFTPVSLAQVIRVSGFRDIQIRGESPVVHDLRSALRAWLWNGMKKLLQFYITLECGTGRGLKHSRPVFESRMYATARKAFP